MIYELVTVVIPIYNTDKYLARCLESIVNQTYKNLEIILVDDGSQDNCSKICDEWEKEDERIKVIHKQNEGAGISRNCGIREANGDFVLFVDSDDYIKLDLVEKCLNKIKGEKASIVMFGVEHVNSTERHISYSIPYSDKYIYTNSEVTELFLPEMLFTTNKQVRNLEMTAYMAHFYSMEIIRKNDWKFESEKEYFSEDLFSLLKLYKFIEKVVVLNEALYCYRHVNDSLSTSRRILNYSQIKKFYHQCMKLCEANNYTNNLKNSLSEPYLSFTIACLKAHMCIEGKISVKYKNAINILKDEQLTRVLENRNLRYEKKEKRILYMLILKQKYNIALLLIYLQNLRRKR